MQRSLQSAARRRILLDQQKSKPAGFGNTMRTRAERSNAGTGVIGNSMLVIVGMILLLTWIFDHALHLAPSSLINLLLLFATISFALDALRERENMRHPKPGWDAMPPRGWFGLSMRRVRQKMDAGNETPGNRTAGPDRPAATRASRVRATRAA
jgi:hypothetical protein